MSCLKPDKMAVLLEDSLNNSVIRFSPQYKKILSLDDCMMMSLDTYVSSPYDMGVFLGGKKSSVQKTIMCLSERNIVSRVNNWHPGNCLSDYNGAMEIRECYSPYAPIDSTMITIHEDKADVKIVKFYPTEVDTVRDCTDIN